MAKSPALKSAELEDERERKYYELARERGMPKWKPCHPRINDMVVLALDDTEVVFYGQEAFDKLGFDFHNSITKISIVR